MSIVQNPLIGAARKKIGNAVFSTWKGIYILKTKPLTVANPQTDEQVTQRSAMSQIVHIFRLISAAVQVGFKEQAVRMSEYNAFVSDALRNAFDLTSPPVAVFEPTDLKTSKGTITPQGATTAIADVSLGTVAVTFPNTSNSPGQSATDLCVVVSFNSTQNTWHAEITNAQRNSGAASISIPAGTVVGNSMFTYVSFFNPSTGKSSDNTVTTHFAVA